LEKKVNAFLTLVGSCAEYIETGSLDAFATLTRVPIDPQDCLFGCELGAARYVSRDFPDVGYLIVKNSSFVGSQIGEIKMGAASVPQEARCLIKPADNLGRTPDSELNSAVQNARQTALKAGRIIPSEGEVYWNEGCGYNGLTYEVETISFDVQNSDVKILHFPGLYYSGRSDLHGNPLDPPKTKTCEEVGL
jgi:hypothetical protein